MKLGILVDYLVKETDEKLLCLHLEQLQQYTTIPYQIYGGTTRLNPVFKPLLQKYGVKTYNFPSEVAMVGSQEHSFHLESLIHKALQEPDLDYLTIFHPDSFPLKPWFEKLKSHLQQHTVVAVARSENKDYKPHTCFMMFSTKFLKEHKPKLLLTKEELSSPLYQKYVTQYPHVTDSGAGLGFYLYKHQLSWHPLLKSNQQEPHPLIASVYEDTIFHLGGASERFQVLNQTIQPIIPYHKPFLLQTILDQAKAKLAQDPAAYLQWLRN